MATATATAVTRKYQVGLSMDQADRLRQATLRRSTRSEVVIEANAEVERLAAKIGKLVHFIETYAGDCSEMEKERWKLVSQMHRLLEWIKRQEV